MMLKKALKREEFRFLLVGASNTVWGIISYPIYFWLLHPLGVNYLVILIMTYIVNGVISFSTQKYLVFKTRGNHLKEFWKYFLLQAATLGINLLVLPLAVQQFSMNPVIAQTVFIGLVIVTSFFFHKYVTFKHKNDLPVASSETHQDKSLEQ